MELQATGGVSVVYVISVPNLNEQAMVTALNTAITTGQFTNALVKSGYPNAFASVAPAVVNMSPTFSPTQAPIVKSQGAAVSTGAIIGMNKLIDQ